MIDQLFHEDTRNKSVFWEDVSVLGRLQNIVTRIIISLKGAKKEPWLVSTNVFRSNGS